MALDIERSYIRLTFVNATLTEVGQSLFDTIVAVIQLQLGSNHFYQRSRTNDAAGCETTR